MPYAGPYSQSAGQALPGAGLGSQLQNKASMPNSMLNQFNVDKKTLPGMVSFCLLRLKFAAIGPETTPATCSISPALTAAGATTRSSQRSRWWCISSSDRRGSGWSRYRRGWSQRWTSNSRPREAQADPTAAGPFTPCSQVPAEGAGQR